MKTAIENKLVENIEKETRFLKEMRAELGEDEEKSLATVKTLADYIVTSCENIKVYERQLKLIEVARSQEEKGITD